MKKGFWKAILFAILFSFAFTFMAFAYNSSELRNYVNQVCIVRIYNPNTPFTSYSILKGKVIEIYDRNGQYFLTLDLGYNGIQDIPIEMIVNIRNENVTER
jgi:hypothetical protein